MSLTCSSNHLIQMIPPLLFAPGSQCWQCGASEQQSNGSQHESPVRATLVARCSFGWSTGRTTCCNADHKRVHELGQLGGLSKLKLVRSTGESAVASRGNAMHTAYQTHTRITYRPIWCTHNHSRSQSLKIRLMDGARPSFVPPLNYHDGSIRSSKPSEQVHCAHIFTFEYQRALWIEVFTE